jgi:hypothetical protein
MATADDNGRGKVGRVLARLRREPTGVRPSTEVRIKLADLPAPLRALARDQSADGLLIEAELPWLKVGSDAEAELPTGTQKGRVRWFGVDATRAGTARLRVFVDTTPPGSPSTPSLPFVHARAPSTRRVWASIFLAVVCSSAALVVGLRIPRPPRLMLLASPVEVPAQVRMPSLVFVPKLLPEVAPQETAADIPPSAPIPQAPRKPQPKPQPQPMRRRR